MAILVSPDEAMSMIQRDSDSIFTRDELCDIIGSKVILMIRMPYKRVMIVGNGGDENSVATKILQRVDIKDIMVKGTAILAYKDEIIS